MRSIFKKFQENRKVFIIKKIVFIYFIIKKIITSIKIGYRGFNERLNLQKRADYLIIKKIKNR